MDDYKVDGITYCGKCNEPKEKKLTVLGKDIFIGSACACEREENKKRQARIEEQRAKDEKARQQELIKQEKQKCFDNPEQMEYTFSVDDKTNEISKVARNYVDKFEELNVGLLLYGSVGTGKTFAACCIANALIEKGYTVLVTNFPKIVNELQSTFEKQEYIDRLMGFDLLIIDDLASERRTEYMDEMVTNIIDSRYRTGKPIIITTNLTTKDMTSTEIDINRKRIYSRLNEMCYPYEVKGEDRRKSKRRNIKDKYKGVLEND